MHVLATAGHVDHGKSTLVRALTGTDPDRLAEEKRRGLTIELGFAWTTLEDREELAFVDVPGHERFLATTVAGMGPAPGVLFVVSADEGWRRQSGEHLAALDALGVDRGLLVITRSDLADPRPAAAQALSELEGSSLAGIPCIAVSALTGQGMPVLRAQLGALLARLPKPEDSAPVRLWIDRSFTVAGTGTVVTGTLGAGLVTVGDTLLLAGAPVTVRGIESMGVERRSVSGTARVALALRGLQRSQVGRGDALLTPGAWKQIDVLDARLVREAELPVEALLHIGSAHVPVSIRRLSASHARLRLKRPLPLAVGDRALLRDPGARRVAAGVIVVDIDPPEFTRRGAAARRAQELAGRGDRPDPVTEVARRGFSTTAELAGLGMTPDTLPDGLLERAGHLVTASHWSLLGARLGELVNSSDSGVSREAVRRALALPNAAVLEALLSETPSVAAAPDGRLVDPDAGLAPRLAAALQTLQGLWADDPLAAPEAGELRAAGLDDATLGALAATGRATRLAPDVVIAPAGLDQAVTVLAGLPQPFTVSSARTALGSSRRIVVPLLQALDRQGVTRREQDGLRRLTGR